MNLIWQIIFWCPRRDSNPQSLRHNILSVACIPIPPLGRSYDLSPPLLKLRRTTFDFCFLQVVIFNPAFECMGVDKLFSKVGGASGIFPYAWRLCRRSRTIGGTGGICTHEWRFCRPLRYYFATVPSIVRDRLQCGLYPPLAELHHRTIIHYCYCFQGSFWLLLGPTSPNHFHTANTFILYLKTLILATKIPPNKFGRDRDF